MQAFSRSSVQRPHPYMNGVLCKPIWQPGTEACIARQTAYQLAFLLGARRRADEGHPLQDVLLHSRLNLDWDRGTACCAGQLRVLLQTGAARLQNPQLQQSDIKAAGRSLDGLPWLWISLTHLVGCREQQLEVGQPHAVAGVAVH